MMFINMKRVPFVRIPDGRRLRLAVVMSQPERFGFDDRSDVVEAFGENGLWVNALKVRSLYETLALAGYVHADSSSR